MTSDQKLQFDEARKLFKGRKNGLEPEWENFTRKFRNYSRLVIVPLLKPAIEKEIAWRKETLKAGMFVPPWKHFQTWLNKQCWTQEFPELPHEETLEEYIERMD